MTRAAMFAPPSDAGIPANHRRFACCDGCVLPLLLGGVLDSVYGLHAGWREGVVLSPRDVRVGHVGALAFTGAWRASTADCRSSATLKRPMRRATSCGSSLGALRRSARGIHGLRAPRERWSRRRRDTRRRSSGDTIKRLSANTTAISRRRDSSPRRKAPASRSCAASTDLGLRRVEAEVPVQSAPPAFRTMDGVGRVPRQADVTSKTSRPATSQHDSADAWRLTSQGEKTQPLHILRGRRRRTRSI